MRYNGLNVPPKGTPWEPTLDSFTRQASNDYFSEWKYNDVIDNLELFIRGFYPFHVSGCNITYIGNYEYSVSEGLVFCGCLVYFAGGTFFTGADNDIYVVRITPDGMIATVKLSLYNYQSDLDNKMCKIGYVCNGVVLPMELPSLFSFLQLVPNTEGFYNTYSFYDTQLRYA